MHQAKCGLLDHQGVDRLSRRLTLHNGLLVGRVDVGTPLLSFGIRYPFNHHQGLKQGARFGVITGAVFVGVLTSQITHCPFQLVQQLFFMRKHGEFQSSTALPISDEMAQIIEERLSGFTLPEHCLASGFELTRNNLCRAVDVVVTTLELEAQV